jgi:hypothetical protein
MTASDPLPEGLEEALRAMEVGAEAAIRALAAATKEAKRAKSAAAVGQVRELQQALESSDRLTQQAGSVVDDLRGQWRFDVGAWLASGDYTKELLVTAQAAGVDAYESDQRILCYPVIVEVSAPDATVVIDKKRQRWIRPSVVIRHLASLQQRPPKFKPEPFIESLVTAYDLLVAAGGRPSSTVKLVDVHAVLTLLPGAAREYTKHEFARDLYLLDQSGITGTKDGRRLNLPASALTRGSGVLTTVTRGGQTKVYAGIAFVAREPREPRP